MHVDGARHVQLEGLRIHNFCRGVWVTSRAPRRGPTPAEPLTGPQDIRLVDLEVCENWEDGVAVNSGFAGVARRLLGLRAAPHLVIGEGTLEAAHQGRLVPVPVDPTGWWPERVSIENCVIEANGEGSRSSGVNVSLAGLASLCVVRHCRIRGRAHSRGWRNQPGRYAAGDEPLPPGASLDPIWRDPARWTWWGVDGIAAHCGGCGNVIEGNELCDHGHAQSGVPPFDCRRDDGNGIDLKNTGNRHYWEDDGRGGRRLPALPWLIRGNRIAGNHGQGVVLHFGCRGLSIEGNLFEGNRGSDGAAICVQAGPALSGSWRGEYRPDRLPGPALVSGLSISDNVIQRNTGPNAVVFKPSRKGWAGSFRGVRIEGNRLLNNAGYGLVLRAVSGPAHADAAEAALAGFVVRGNTFAGNEGAARVVAPTLALAEENEVDGEVRVG